MVFGDVCDESRPKDLYAKQFKARHDAVARSGENAEKQREQVTQPPRFLMYSLVPFLNSR
jgi:hypothetical protein